MSDYISLSNSNSTLTKKFRVLQTGYSPVRRKVGTVRTTVTGKVDNQVGPILGQWNYTLRIYDVDPTDPAGSDDDTEGYGTLEHLKTFFDYNDPAGTPSNVITFVDINSVSASTGALLAGAGVDSGGIGPYWQNPGNITADDGVYANGSATDVTHYLTASNFGFAIPSASVIVGVTASIKRRTSPEFGSLDHTIMLQYNNNMIGDNKADHVTHWPTTWGTKSYGSGTDRWGCLLSPAIVNSSGFGLTLRSLNYGGIGDIDFMKLTIDHKTNLYQVYLLGKFSEKVLSSYILGGCAVFDVPVTIMAAEALIE